MADFFMKRGSPKSGKKRTRRRPKTREQAMIDRAKESGAMLDTRRPKKKKRGRRPMNDGGRGRLPEMADTPWNERLYDK